MDAHIIGEITMLSSTAHQISSAHSFRSHTQHIFSYISQGSQTLKHAIIRFSMIDIQAYNISSLHALSHQGQQNYSYLDHGLTCLHTC